MPGYGIAEGEQGLLPWSWAMDHLREARRYWVATADSPGALEPSQPSAAGDGRLVVGVAPHLSAVWAVWVEDALWFSCGARSRKARNLGVNGRCSVATERADEAVTMTGSAHRVEDVALLGPVTDAYVTKYGDGFPDPAINPLFAVLPDVVIGIIEAEAEFTTRATRWTFSSSQRVD